jgi:hypothetical protein
MRAFGLVPPTVRMVRSGSQKLGRHHRRAGAFRLFVFWCCPNNLTTDFVRLVLALSVLSAYLATRKCLGVNVGITGTLLDSLQYFSECVCCGFGSTTGRTLLEDTLCRRTDHIGGCYRPAHSARARAIIGTRRNTGGRHPSIVAQKDHDTGSFPREAEVEMGEKESIIANAVGTFQIRVGQRVRDGQAVRADRRG